MSWTGGPTGVMPTPQDSVEEFKVNTAGQTADFNSSAGAEVKIVTKRGTNAWHGTGYEYYNDNNWSSQMLAKQLRQHSGSGSASPSQLPLQPRWRCHWWPNHPQRSVSVEKHTSSSTMRAFRWPDNSVTHSQRCPLAKFDEMASSLTPSLALPTTWLRSIPRGIGLNPLVSTGLEHV